MRGEGKKVEVCACGTPLRELALLPAKLYLKALRTDFLPLLHPGDARSGVARCLAYK